MPAALPLLDHGGQARCGRQLTADHLVGGPDQATGELCPRPAPGFTFGTQHRTEILGHRVHQSARGGASRYGDLALTLLEDGPDELRAALQKQAEIEEEAAAVLTLGHRDEHTLTASCPSYEKPAT